MQNAKCKIDEAFRLRESLFHGNILHADTQKASAHKGIFKENFFRFSLSRSLILHFAFGLCPTTPNLKYYCFSAFILISTIPRPSVSLTPTGRVCPSAKVKTASRSPVRRVTV